MRERLLAVTFTLLSLVNATGAFFAIFPFLGMLTNANGFMSGGASDVAALVAVLAFPIGLIVSAALFRQARLQVAGLVVAALPVVIAAVVVGM